MAGFIYNYRFSTLDFFFFFFYSFLWRLCIHTFLYKVVCLLRTVDRSVWGQPRHHNANGVVQKKVFNKIGGQALKTN